MLYMLVPPLRGHLTSPFEQPVEKVSDTVSGWWHSLTYPYDDIGVRNSSASAEFRDAQADDAFDGNIATYWAAPWSRKEQPALVVRFDGAQTVAAIVVHNGASAEDADKYLQAKTLLFKYGNRETEEVSLKLSGDAQTVKIDSATTVGVITITVTEVFPKDGVADVALSEIEFKSKK